LIGYNHVSECSLIDTKFKIGCNVFLEIIYFILDKHTQIEYKMLITNGLSSKNYNSKILRV
jgi:hypothetical protein